MKEKAQRFPARAISQRFGTIRYYGFCARLHFQIPRYIARFCGTKSVIQLVHFWYIRQLRVCCIIVGARSTLTDFLANDYRPQGNCSYSLAAPYRDSNRRSLRGGNLGYISQTQLYHGFGCLSAYPPRRVASSSSAGLAIY